MDKIITKSEKETGDLGEQFAKTLIGGETIELSGELGAGKTRFTQGLAVGLGIKNRVNSPTFVLMKVYKTKLKNIKFFVHVDAYRLEGAKNLDNIGLAEYINNKDAIVVIEWPEKIKNILPKNSLKIFFKTKQDSREIKIFR